MTWKLKSLAVLATAVFLGSASTSWAETDLDKTIAQGGEILTADQLVEKFNNTTAQYVSADGKREFLVYYGTDNDVRGKMVNGKWADTGFFAVADTNMICLSWQKSDKPRIRCLHAVQIDGVVRKFKPDGSFRGTVVKFDAGMNF